MQRRRLLVFLLPLVVLAAGVPWFFVEASDERVLGLPLWAAFAVLADFVLAVVLAFLLGRFWNLAAGDEVD